MPEFTAAQNEQYYRVRLDPYKLNHSKGTQYRAMCPLHGGSNHSQLWVDFAEGNFFCFTCQAKGGSAYTFEQKMLALELNRSPLHDEVQKSLEAILGQPITQRIYNHPVSDKQKAGWDRRRAQARYVYTDEDGRELYSVWRFQDRNGNKATPPDRPCDCGGNTDAECASGCVDGRVWGLDGVRRVIYRLPDVLQSLLVFIVEGERNADDLSRALAQYIARHKGFPFGDLILDRVAVTTNPSGASGWKKEHGFGRYFFGKTVVKLGDNDAAGRLHDRDVCEDVSRYARHLYRLDLPVGESEDISDYLGEHSIDELLSLLPGMEEWKVSNTKQPGFKSSEEERVVLIRPSKLLKPGAANERDWLIDGLIARGKRGLVIAPPKAGKSLMFLDIVLCLASGQSFLGAKPYERGIRCAVISREDGPDELFFRLRALGNGRGLSWPEIDANLYVNTWEQTANFQIDNQRDVLELAEWLRAAEIEFCVLDVLNRLHSGKENSSDDMTKVMLQFDELARLAGCQVCVIHHANKQGQVKGSTSIEGWADYIVRIEPMPDDDTMKILSLKSKSSAAIAPRILRYFQSDDKQTSRISVVTPR